MSGCERALDLIGLRLDGPLSPEEQRELDAHLEQCPACRAAARELEELEGPSSSWVSAIPAPARLRRDGAGTRRQRPCQGRPALETPCLPGSTGHGGLRRPVHRPASPNGGSLLRRREQHRRRPCQRLGVPGRFLHSRCRCLCCRRGVLPLCRGPLQQCGPSGSRGHRPDGGGVPRLHRSLLPAGTGSGRTGGLLRPCPRPVRRPGRTAGPESRPAAPVLHHSRGTGGPGLAGDGRLSLDRPGSGGGTTPCWTP